MSLPNVQSSAPIPETSQIAGSVLPIQRAEELLLTLPGVISARIVADTTGAVEEIHVLTTDAVSPKQTVRNIESALIAHLGMRVSHKKISVAMTTDPSRPRLTPNGVPAVFDRPSSPQGIPAVPATPAPALATPIASVTPIAPMPVVTGVAGAMATPVAPVAVVPEHDASRRHLYFEDIEVRRSRSRGVLVRVTLRKGDEEYIGEAEGMENERIRVELAARATLSAIATSGETRALGLEGYRIFDAFEREFVFVAVTVRSGRETSLLTGTAEVRESAETAAVLAVLDATNRWGAFTK